MKSETVRALRSNLNVCFDVVAKSNTSIVPQGVAQRFRARITLATHTCSVGLGLSSEITFVVPPAIPQPALP